VRRSLLALGAGGALFAFAAADLLLHGPLTAADPAISTWLHGHMQPVATTVLFAFTHLHSTIGLSIMSAVLAVFFVATHRPRWILPLLLTVQGGQLLNAGLKDMFGRARPHWDDPLITLTTASFPSGHAAGTTVFWGFVCVAAWSLDAPVAVKRALSVIAPLMVFATCLSRVYLGAHYFSDVLAGVGEGTAWVALCTLLLRARTMRA
jgi:undecaprenyl-diphosphatase